MCFYPQAWKSKYKVPLTFVYPLKEALYSPVCHKKLKETCYEQMDLSVVRLVIIQIRQYSRPVESQSPRPLSEASNSSIYCVCEQSFTLTVVGYHRWRSVKIHTRLKCYLSSEAPGDSLNPTTVQSLMWSSHLFCLPLLLFAMQEDLVICVSASSPW